MADLSKLVGDYTGEHEAVYAQDIVVRMRPMPNPQFDAFLSSLKRKETRKLSRGNLDGEDVQRLTKRAMANTVITGWDNLQLPDQDGNPVDAPFTAEACFRVFMDPRYYAFYRWCREEAGMLAEDIDGQDEDSLGN